LSGIEITDSHKFTNHYTAEQWIVFIDEAWALRDTTLHSAKYPEFNAAKVINYVAHRDSYRKRAPVTVTPVDQRARLLKQMKEASANVNEPIRRFRQLRNLVMRGLLRSDLQGFVSESDLSALFP